MTATGSHEYFYSLRGAQPPGEGLRPAGSAYEIRAHRGMPPHLHSKTVVPTAPHPSRAKARATFPQGKAFLRGTDTPGATPKKP